jgi:hypothetical protein
MVQAVITSLTFCFTATTLNHSQSSQNSPILETPHVATSSSTDTQELQSTCISLPSQIQFSRKVLSPSAIQQFWVGFCDNFMPTGIMLKSDIRWLWLVAKPLLWNIFLQNSDFKIVRPSSHSIKHNLCVLGASYTTVLNILLCPHQGRTKCLWSLVDNAQPWFLTHHVSCRWVAQLSTNYKMFWPCTPIETLINIKMVMVIHTILDV